MFCGLMSMLAGGAIGCRCLGTRMIHYHGTPIGGKRVEITEVKRKATE
jgi:hypothetical protein